MFKLSMNLFNTFTMSLSKKNLDKLNKYKKNKNFNNDTNNSNSYTKIDHNVNSTKNTLKSEDPYKIFYSLIDNSESLDETSKVNHSLRSSEINKINMNSRKTDYSNNLSIEEELYDEFNYLLDE